MLIGPHSIKTEKFTQLFHEAVHFWAEFYNNPQPSVDYSQALTLLSYAGTTPLVLIPGALNLSRESTSHIICRVPSAHFYHYLEHMKVAAINENFGRFYEAFDSLIEDAKNYSQQLESL